MTDLLIRIGSHAVDRIDALEHKLMKMIVTKRVPERFGWPPCAGHRQIRSLRQCFLPSGEQRMEELMCTAYVKAEGTMFAPKATATSRGPRKRAEAR